MFIKITVTHTTGHTYRLCTTDRDWTETQAIEQAKRDATRYFGLLPEPTSFTLKVEHES